MCGILAIFGSSLPDLELRKKLIECSQRLRHRGPDWSGYLVEPGTGIGHERLAIIDPESGAQPLYSADKKIVVAANGEVYNYKDLYASLAVPYAPLTGSDCEVVIPLYQAHGIDFPKYLRGMFSLVVYDRTDGSFYATRDHVGKTPMYMGYVCV
jgi:asparagine synthase (glutamine-hydrolysing)